MSICYKTDSGFTKCITFAINGPKPCDCANTNLLGGFNPFGMSIDNGIQFNAPSAMVVSHAVIRNGSNQVNYARGNIGNPNIRNTTVPEVVEVSQENEFLLTNKPQGTTVSAGRAIGLVPAKGATGVFTGARESTDCPQCPPFNGSLPVKNELYPKVGRLVIGNNISTVYDPAVSLNMSMATSQNGGPVTNYSNMRGSQITKMSQAQIGNTGAKFVGKSSYGNWLLNSGNASRFRNNAYGVPLPATTNIVGPLSVTNSLGVTTVTSPVFAPTLTQQRQTLTPIKRTSVAVVAENQALLTAAAGGVNTPVVVSGGTGYVITEPQDANLAEFPEWNALPTSGGSGVGMTVRTVRLLGMAGTVGNVEIVASGYGYSCGDLLTILSGNNNATFRVTSVSTGNAPAVLKSDNNDTLSKSKLPLATKYTGAGEVVARKGYASEANLQFPYGEPATVTAYESTNSGAQPQGLPPKPATVPPGVATPLFSINAGLGPQLYSQRMSADLETSFLINSDNFAALNFDPNAPI